jgi:anaerobic dimethyl sulfoxide reductase subunit A
MYGTGHVGIDVRRLEEAGAIVLWGFNPFDTRFGSETEAFLLELAKRGKPFYVVDPRRTTTVRKLGARWFPIKPGSDGVLFTALIHHIISGESGSAFDRTELERYTVGFDALADHITGKADGIRRDAAWASSISSLPVAGIEELSAIFAERRPVALLPGLSIQRTLGGEEADRLAGVLQLVSGNAMFPGGTIGSGQWNSLPKPSCGRIPVPGCGDIAEVPVYTWPDAVLEGVEGGFPSSPRFLYCVGGNPLGQGSDLAKSARAFEKADFSVVHDCFMTESALRADVVLPVAAFLEREDICFTNGNYLFYSAPAADPPGEARSDYRIFSDLAELLGFRERFTEGLSEEEWIRSFLKESEVEDVEEFLDSGIYIGKERKRRGLKLFFEDPGGHPLDTPSGKIEIACESYARAGGPLYPVAAVHVPPEDYPLMLITPHEKYRIHSQFDNIAAFKKLCDDRLWMHTDDAAARGIVDGDRVIISTLRGELLLYARVSGDIAAGTVSAHQGAWPAVEEASGIYCSNVNVLTTTEPTLPSRGARTHTNFAEVRRWHEKE